MTAGKEDLRTHPGWPGATTSGPERMHVERSRATQDTLDASAGSFLLPGVMHRLRNLLFKATCKLQLLEAPADAPRNGAGAAAEAQLALEEMRGLMDLLEAGAGIPGMNAAPLWLESGSAAMTRVADCLGFPVHARQLAFQAQIEPELPGLGVSPALLLRWSAVALRHLLDRVPPGLRGTVLAQGGRHGAGHARLQFAFRPAAGFLPLTLPLGSLREDLVAQARAEEFQLELTGQPYPSVRLLLPLRVAGAEAALAAAT